MVPEIFRFPRLRKLPLFFSIKRWFVYYETPERD
jgi:hypothetical protein